MTVAPSFDALFEQWRAASRRPVDVVARDHALQQARRMFQDKAIRDDAWIIAAFDDCERWPFAINVVAGILPRPLLEEAVEFSKRQGYPYVLSVLRDKGLVT